jgi:hypothetical protein
MKKRDFQISNHNPKNKGKVQMSKKQIVKSLGPKNLHIKFQTILYVLRKAFKISMKLAQK